MNLFDFTEFSLLYLQNSVKFSNEWVQWLVCKKNKMSEESLKRRIVLVIYCPDGDEIFQKNTKIKNLPRKDHYFHVLTRDRKSHDF